MMARHFLLRRRLLVLQALMRRSKARGPTRYTELTTTTVLPCPEQCGEFITAQNVEVPIVPTASWGKEADKA